MRLSDLDPELNSDGELIFGGSVSNHAQSLQPFDTSITHVIPQAEIVEALSTGGSDVDENGNLVEDGGEVDSIFASDDESGLVILGEHRPAALSTELSELPRLQREHATNGYRDGVTAAKAMSIQGGFDEGFSLGATFGKIAGQLQGMLNTIAEAFPENSSERTEIAAFTAAAEKDLCVEAIFAPELWNNDGTWKYIVPGEKEETDLDGMVVFIDVAKAHPVIRKWTETVDELMARWDIKWTISGREGDEDRIVDENVEQERKPPMKGVGLSAGVTKSSLDW
ncbi:Uncharacterized protein yae1 [Ceratocystis fimbriata CBS 114723]|uniref:Protein YAE1 n=1 Tax=Ceratocystis fimbriata CBS 114723 TaxID=1035309 RepID=A0A2C5X0V6_9PEZI|nr:Uncharacterized protein yae1 [Ceratocystis fimbriata CBS 114723]